MVPQRKRVRTRGDRSGIDPARIGLRYVAIIGIIRAVAFYIGCPKQLAGPEPERTLDSWEREKGNENRDND